MCDGRARILKGGKTRREWRRPRRKAGSSNGEAARERAVGHHTSIGRVSPGCHLGRLVVAVLEELGSKVMRTSRMRKMPAREYKVDKKSEIGSTGV